MGEAKVVLSGDEMRLLKSLDKIVQKERELARKTSETGKAGKKAGRDMENAYAGAARQIGGALKVFGGFAGIAGIKMVLSSTLKTMIELGDKTIAFEKGLNDLAFIGNNAQNISAIRKEVLLLSSAWGVSRDEVSAAMYAIESSTSGASKTIRDELLNEALKITKVSSQDLPSAINMMIKAWNIYGKEVGNVTRIQSKLSQAAQNVGFGDLTDYLENVLAPAKAVGASFDDILAALSVAVERGGKSKKTFTGLRDIFLKMDVAIEKGATSQKAFVEQLQDLAKLDTTDLKKIFGVESVGVLHSLVSAIGDYRTALDSVKNVQRDMAGDKFWDRLKDASFHFSEVIKGIRELRENEDFLDEAGQKQMTKFEATKLGLKKQWGPIIYGLMEKTGLADWSAGVNTLLGPDKPKRFFGDKKLGMHQIGYQDRINKLRASGQNALADYEYFKYFQSDEVAQNFYDMVKKHGYSDPSGKTVSFEETGMDKLKIGASGDGVANHLRIAADGLEYQNKIRALQERSRKAGGMNAHVQ